MEYRYCIQCVDKLSGKLGCFVFADNSFEAISPVFSDLMGLFIWMKGKYVDNSWKGDQYVPLRVTKV